MGRDVGGDDIHDPLEKRPERREMPQKVVCYRAEGENGGLN